MKIIAPFYTSILFVLPVRLDSFIDSFGRKEKIRRIDSIRFDHCSETEKNSDIGEEEIN